jgi:hypothetical protein
LPGRHRQSASRASASQYDPGTSLSLWWCRLIRRPGCTFGSRLLRSGVKDFCQSSRAPCGIFRRYRLRVRILPG